MCANYSSLDMTMVMRKITLATSLMTVMDMDMGMDMDMSMITDTTMTTILTIPMLIATIHNEKESRIRMY